MKPFEALYLCIHRFVLPLQGQIRRELVRIARTTNSPEILDVGGRKSHYTIGVPGRITITDLYRTTELQKGLNLGVTEEMIRTTLARRSNIAAILVDDMTKSSLSDESFDCVVAVEVLEHVKQDGAFVREVHRLLRPGGILLMSTPNGDWVPNTNPDHLRHYSRDQLHALLSQCFRDVEVEYAIKDGKVRRLGLQSWSFRHPLRTLVGMFCNLINSIQSASRNLRHQSQSTRHLIARARKSASPAQIQRRMLSAVSKRPAGSAVDRDSSCAV